MSAIFDDHLIKHGPWQEFERNMARLLLHTGWKHVRLVGRTGDGGADVIAVDAEAKVWVFQCKFSSRTPPGKKSIDEVRNAGRLYGADALGVVTSLAPTAAFQKELGRLKAQGLLIRHAGPKYLVSANDRA